MYPPVIQFETRQMELEAALGVYGTHEALAQRDSAAMSSRESRSRRLGLAARVWALVVGPSALNAKRTELRRIPLFASLPRRSFKLLERAADVVEVPAGEVLIKEGDI